MNFRKITKAEEQLANDVDKDLSNPWNFAWLEEIVKVKVDLNGKPTEVDVRLGDAICKIDRAGYAFCNRCKGKPLKYENGGVKDLKRHVSSTKKH